jgi:dihydroflavonol-4-reductase
MRVVLTGATGFIGAVVARQLRDRGDDVVAYVRNPAKAGPLRDGGCEVVEGSLVDRAAMQAALDGADALIHAAGMYEVGIPDGARDAMYESYVTATETVLDAAMAAGTGRIVYVSTLGAAGNTHGAIADEAFEHEPGYVSYYDETKHLAHVAAKGRIAQGAPVVIVQPGGVYGPGDTSVIATAIDLFLKRRMPVIPLPDAGISLAHVEDVAAGIIAALDKGRVGEAYILSGDNVTTRQMIETLAGVVGRKPPRLDLPTVFLRALAPVGPVVAPAMGLPPNLRETISAGEGVTYWGTSAKAEAELGYNPRPLAVGLEDLLRAEGRL